MKRISAKSPKKNFLQICVSYFKILGFLHRHNYPMDTRNMIRRCKEIELIKLKTKSISLYLFKFLVAFSIKKKISWWNTISLADSVRPGSASTQYIRYHGELSFFTTLNAVVVLAQNPITAIFLLFLYRSFTASHPHPHQYNTNK